MTKRIVQVPVYLVMAGGWLIKFPKPIGDVVARDKTMVRNLVKHYGKEHNVQPYILWDGIRS